MMQIVAGFSECSFHGFILLTAQVLSVIVFGYFIHILYTLKTRKPMLFFTWANGIFSLLVLNGFAWMYAPFESRIAGNISWVVFAALVILLTAKLGQTTKRQQMVIRLASEVLIVVVLLIIAISFYMSHHRSLLICG